MTSHTLARFDASKDLQEDCAFCRIVSGQSPAYVVHQDDDSMAFLDILPLRPGHTLVIPKRHVQQVSHLDAQTAASLSKALVQTTRIVGKGEWPEDSLCHLSLEAVGICSLISSALCLALACAMLCDSTLIQPWETKGYKSSQTKSTLSWFLM